MALALNDPVARITKILPGSNKNRVAATAVAYLTIVLILGALISLLTPIIADQVKHFSKDLPQIVKNYTGEESGIRRFIVENHLEGMISQAVDSITRSINSSVSKLGDFFFGSIASIVGWLISLFMILAMAFLMLVEGPDLLDKIFKRSKKITAEFFQECMEQFQAMFRALLQFVQLVQLAVRLRRQF